MEIIYLLIGLGCFLYHQLRNEIEPDIINILLVVIITFSLTFGI